MGHSGGAEPDDGMTDDQLYGFPFNVLGIYRTGALSGLRKHNVTCQPPLAVASYL